MEELENLRRKIDKIDEELMILLKKRSDLSKLVGEVKKEYNLPIYDKQRWEFILESKRKLAQKFEVPIQLVENIWNDIHEYSKSLQ